MELPAALTGRPFAVADAHERGVPRSACDVPELRTALRGVRADREVPDTVESLAAAALVVAPAGAVISHLTALRLHGVELPWPLSTDERIHLTVPPRATVSERAALVAHRATHAPARRDVAGLPTACPELAWRQVCATADELTSVVVADALLRRTDPVSTLDALRQAVAEMPPGARGRRRAARALLLARPGTDSSMETRTRLALVSAGLPCPLVNVPVLDANGRLVALPDMQYTAARIAIEYDGDVHRTDRVTWRRDVERRQRLEDLGWVMVTATADDVLRHPERLIVRVRRHLTTRTAPR